MSVLLPKQLCNSPFEFFGGFASRCQKFWNQRRQPPTGAISNANDKMRRLFRPGSCTSSSGTLPLTPGPSFWGIRPKRLAPDRVLLPLLDAPDLALGLKSRRISLSTLALDIAPVYGCRLSCNISDNDAAAFGEAYAKCY